VRLVKPADHPTLLQEAMGNMNASVLAASKAANMQTEIQQI